MSEPQSAAAAAAPGTQKDGPSAAGRADLELDHVDCGYGRRHIVLRDVSLTLRAGEACCLLGPNGVGKTTLFRTLLGRLAPLRGRVLVEGRDRAGLSERQFARTVAYVPQATDVPADLTVLDVALAGSAARLGTTQAPGREEYKRAGEALGELGIDRLADCSFSEVSGGERQMALIARALVQDARIVLMDEPTASLDFGNQVRVLSCVHRLVAAGQGVAMTSHNPEHAFLCCTRAMLLKPGGELVDGPVEEVVRADALAEAYGVGVLIGEIEGADGARVRACVPELSCPRVPQRHPDERG